MVVDQDRTKGSKTGRQIISKVLVIYNIFFRQDMNVWLGNNLSLRKLKVEKVIKNV